MAVSQEHASDFSLHRVIEQENGREGSSTSNDDTGNTGVAKRHARKGRHFRRRRVGTKPLSGCLKHPAVAPELTETAIESDRARCVRDHAVGGIRPWHLSSVRYCLCAPRGRLPCTQASRLLGSNGIFGVHWVRTLLREWDLQLHSAFVRREADSPDHKLRAC